MNDGGPAFPRAASEYTANGTLPDGNDAVRQQDGMSLRDYFAAATLTGLAGDDQCGDWQPGEYAAFAYGLADAMIKYREQKP